MKKSTLFIIVGLLIVLAIIYANDVQKKMTLSIANANRPQFINQQYYAIVYCPSSISVDQLHGDGIVVGNANTVQNETV